jgi:hypothetical protein
MMVGCEISDNFLAWWSTRFARVFAKNEVQNVVF